MHKKVLRMNRSAAKRAVMHAKTILVVMVVLAVRCMTRYAHRVEKPARFLLSLVETVRYTAAAASRDK